MFILIAGLPGSGKTSLAKAIAAKLGALHISSDLVRQELGLRGSYSPASKAKVYETVWRQAKQALAQGETVVVDSTFYLASLRIPFDDLAAEFGLKPLWLLATAPDEVLLHRVKKPRADSEADEAVLVKIKSQFEPIEQPFWAIDTSKKSAEELADALIEKIRNGQATSTGHP